MGGFVIDANAIHAFQKERIENIRDIAINSIELILENDVIVLDDEQLCMQEWLDCASGSFPFALSDWISNQLVEQKIIFCSLGPNDCRRSLLELGLPHKDHKWVRLAIGCGGRKIVTGDVDFFDPTQKNASAKIKNKLRSQRSGKCAKTLRKKFSVQVMCYEHVSEFI